MSQKLVSQYMSDYDRYRYNQAMMYGEYSNPMNNQPSFKSAFELMEVEKKAEEHFNKLKTNKKKLLL